MTAACTMFNVEQHHAVNREDIYLDVQTSTATCGSRLTSHSLGPDFFAS